MDQHFAERIALKEAASLAKMSVPQFIKLFKRVAGTTFVSYVTHVRLSHAVRLLKGSSLPLLKWQARLDLLTKVILIVV